MGIINSSDSNQGYCVVPLNEVESDWKKVVLANHLLRINLAVYRNSVSFGHHPAGSFFVPLGSQRVNQEQISGYLAREAKRLGVSLVFYQGELHTGVLKKLVNPRVAVLYDTGQKYSLMILNVLETLGFYTEALSANDVFKGALDHANILVIPGGIHTDKVTEFGSKGEARVKDFVRRGGGVLGICGGAVLAAQIHDGWGLLEVERQSGRVPKTMQGPIWIKPEAGDHPLWYGYSSDGFPLALWYGRALHPLSDEVKVLGRYDRPTSDFYIDHELTGSCFSEYLPEEIGTLDKVYDGLANPMTIYGMTAIVEGKYGAGKIIATYPHPETPGIQGGFLLLANAIYHVTQNPPFDEPSWLESVNVGAYRELRLLSLIEEVREYHNSLVMPIVNDLVKFGTRNLYWTLRPHVPWCYIGKGKYPFYVCEQLEAYANEISRQLYELPILIEEINAKLERLLVAKAPAQMDDRVKQVITRLDNVHRSGEQMLNQTPEIYRAKIQPRFYDWVTNLKKVLLYRHLLVMMQAQKADLGLVEEVSRKSRELTREYIGGWRWPQASKNYREFFTALDTTSYHLSNLKFQLTDISLQLEGVFLVAS